MNDTLSHNDMFCIPPACCGTCIGGWRRGQLHATTLVLRRILRGVDERRIAVLPSVTASVNDLEVM